MQPHDIPAKPFDIVAMDFITGLPVTERGYDSVLTIVDRFSKLCVLVPVVSTLDAEACARVFWDKWVTRFGVPLKLISDRDVKFTSLFWQSLMKSFNCRLNLSSAFHP